MKNFKILFFLLLCCNLSIGQNLEYGSVSIEELSEKIHPLDTSAVAAILYSKAKTNFLNSNVHQTEFTIRIKIYKKEGLNYANYEVPFYTGYKNINDDSVKFSDCVTYNLVDGKIKITKLSNEGTFKENINSEWGKSSITMPDVKVGSIIEINISLGPKTISIYQNFIFSLRYLVTFRNM